MSSRLKEHINMSKNISRCKQCQELFKFSYFDQIFCNKCDKKYKNIH